MAHGEDWHLQAYECILYSCGEIIWAVAGNISGEGTKKLEDRQEEALPIRCEDDQLDTQEFWHGSEWLEIL